MKTKTAHHLIRNLHFPVAAAVAAILFCIGANAFAASAGMPWEGPISQLVTSLTGPVAKGIGIAGIVITALGMVIAESGHAMKKFITIIFALSICFTVGQFALPFLGFSGGLAL
ncbi:MAG TPA: TrbC/VirB2 family protein [Polyangia bacterium]|nr:TrbC/VirB2 family protein [Polyangia bacterium]